MKISLKQGYGALDLSVPDDKILDVVTGREAPALDVERAAEIIEAGIRETAPADIRTRKIAVLIPDDTRLWARGDRFVPVIVKALLDLEVPEDRITILIALGTHADIPPARFPLLAGEFCAGRITILNSANRNRNRLVSLGHTRRGTPVEVTREACDADHVIVFGGILHHVLAGFGGGRKYILPGIAGYDAIQRNHSLAVEADGTPHPRVRQAVLDGNPVHEDMQEAARIFLRGKTSCFAAVAANGAGELFYAEAGELDRTFLRGCDQVNRACAVEVPAKGEFALISAGGHRTDGQLYQSTKALFNTVGVVKDGGDILFVARADEGVGNPVFEAALRRYRGDPRPLGEALARSFEMPAYVACRVIDMLHRFRITLVSGFSREETLSLGFRYADNLPEYVRGLKGRGYVLPHAENVLPLVKKTHGRR
ncbi:MAG: lactate racemase domain-containing protein [Desulfococcaceae bacterium]